MINLNANVLDVDSGSIVANFDWKWYLKDLEPPKEGAPTVFSCFACGGGSSMGYKRAGFNVLGNCEIDPKIAEIYQKNLHPKHSYVMDIRDFNKLNDLPDELMNLDVLDGSPPCSTFSTQGSREKAWGVEKRFAEGQKLQTLDDLFFVFLDTVEKLMPKVVVAENVTGLIKGNARGYVNQIIKRFHQLGYDVQLFKLDASYMDVPQKRERIFFIANRCRFSKLKLEFNQKPILFGGIRTEVGSNKIDSNTKLLELYGKPSDKDIRTINRRVNNSESGFSTRILHDNRVADTLTTCTHLRYYDKKYMAPEDMINVSTFPQDYNFGTKNNLGGVCFICGMSVPPNMMAHIASEIRRQWFD